MHEISYLKFTLNNLNHQDQKVNHKVFYFETKLHTFLYNYESIYTNSNDLKFVHMYKLSSSKLYFYFVHSFISQEFENDSTEAVMVRYWQELWAPEGPTGLDVHDDSLSGLAVDAGCPLAPHRR